VAKATISPQDLIAVKQKAMMNLVAFRYLLLSTDEYEVLPPEYHYEWSNGLLDGRGNQATEGFRESGKTQIDLRAFLLYCLTFPCKERDYIVLIKNNATLAGSKLKEIEREYKENPILSANKVKIHEESGDVFCVDVRDVFGETHNVRIEAYGKGASIRGLANKDRRPRIVIIDDPQDTEDAQSDTVTDSDWNWFLSDVMFLGQNTRIFLIGNNLGEKCIIERVFANAKELNFTISKVPAIIDGQSAWPSKYTIEAIEKSKEDYRKLGKLDIWFREKMCEAISDETRTFLREDFRYYSPTLINDIASKCAIFIAVDLAISEKRAADYTAIPVVGVNPEGHWFIFDCVYGRFDPSQTIDHLFSLVKRWRPSMVGIEKVAYQRALVHFVMKEMPLRNQFFPVFELVAEKQKELRIKALQPRFKAHTVWLPEHAPWLTEMESELLMFPKGLHDDLIDAMAYIPAFAYPMNRNDVLRADLVRAGIPAGDAGLEFSNTGKYDPMAVLHGSR
jgi:predicted phage terminase large subunit-like protein